MLIVFALLVFLSGCAILQGLDKGREGVKDRGLATATQNDGVL
jgi:uncharacterized protein YceK